MTKSKKLAAIFLCAVFLVTGCHSDSSYSSCSTTEANGTTAAAKEQVKLLVWESEGGPDLWIQQAAEAFTAENPNIIIEFENIELTDNITELIARRESGTGADLFAAPHDEVGRIASEGLAIPVANAENVASQVLGVCSSALSVDGVLYGYPTSAETYALYYNKALISQNEVPASWDELYDYAKEFEQKNEGKYALVFDVTTAYYTNLFATNGGNRLFGGDGNDTSALYTDMNKAVKGYVIFKELRNVFDVNAADITGDFVDGQFTSGNAAMCISGPWSISKYADAGIDFGVTVLPAFEGESVPSCSFTGIRGLFVSAQSKHPEEAMKFAEFLTTQEMQKLRYEITGALPSVDLAIDNDITLGFIKQLEYSCPMPSVPQMSVFWSNAIEASKAIWDGADVETELKKLENTVIKD